MSVFFLETRLYENYHIIQLIHHIPVSVHLDYSTIIFLSGKKKKKKQVFT